MKTFSIEEALRKGWEITKANIGYLIGVILVASFVPQLIIRGGQAMTGKGSFVGLLVIVIGVLISVFLQFNSIKIFLGLVDGRKLPFNTLFEYDSRIGRYLGATVIYSVIVMIGTILLIVPGIIATIALGFFGMAILDKNLGATQSLKYSAATTKGARLQLFWLSLVCLGVNIVGAILFLIGLLVTIPLTVLAYTYAYRKLTEQTDQVVVHEDHAPVVPSEAPTV